jgi:hypothetical protein
MNANRPPAENPRRLAGRLLPAALVALIVAPGLAVAEDNVTVFAGGVLDNASYGSIGAQVSLPGASAGHGFAIRGSAFLGGYQYTDGSGDNVDATFGGGELDGVYSWSGRWGYVDAFVGARNMDTRLEPLDPTNRRLGDQTEPVIGTDGARSFGPWRTDWYGAYGARLDDYQTRVSLAHQIGPGWRLGGEVGFEGDPTYELQRVGPYVAVSLGAHSEVQASAGLSHQNGRDDRGYLRVGWDHSF